MGIGIGRGAAPAMQREWAARLPFTLVFGPLRLAVEWRDAAHMSARHADACIDLDAGRIELSQRLSGLALAEAFLRCVLRLSHAGRVARSAWAAPAQRTATGLVEFAWQNPRAWLWFNLLLAQHLAGRPRLDRALRGQLAPTALPRQWRVGGAILHMRPVVSTALGSADGVFDAQRHEIRFAEALAGTDLVVVLLRELGRAMHDAEAPGRTSPPPWRAQSHGWLRLVRDNPQGWCWLLAAIAGPGGSRRALH